MSNTIPIRKINEFVKNERSEGFYLIKSVDLKTTNSNGKKYLDFVLLYPNKNFAIVQNHNFFPFSNYCYCCCYCYYCYYC